MDPQPAVEKPTVYRVIAKREAGDNLVVYTVVKEEEKKDDPDPRTP